MGDRDEIEKGEKGKKGKKGKKQEGKRYPSRSDSADIEVFSVEESVGKALEEVSERLLTANTNESWAKTLELILSSLQDISKAIQAQAESQEVYRNEAKTQAENVAALLAEITTCKKENVQLREENIKLCTKVNELEQYSKNFNVEIQGVPVTDGEDVYELVCTIANHLGCELHPNDIEFCHRLRKSDKIPNKPPTIIAKLYSRRDKEAILNGKKENKNLTAGDIGFQNLRSKIFVNEHLTASNKNLFWLARSTKQLGYKFVWVKRGKIFIKKDEASKTIAIHTPADIPVHCEVNATNATQSTAIHTSANITAHCEVNETNVA